jgi:hypothetical protein
LNVLSKFGKFFTPLRCVEAAKILCSIITRWAL